MSDTIDDDVAGDSGPGGEPTDERQRYGTIEMPHGDVVIYDQERPTAWLQSDLAVPLDV